MLLYHVTPSENFPGIIEHGLEPRIGPRAAAFGEPRPATYYFLERAELYHALLGWLGEVLPMDYHVLVVNVADELVETIEGETDWEARTYTVIPPKAIIEHLSSAWLTDDWFI